MTRDREDKSKTPKNNKYPEFKHIVSEGSMVILDARDLIKDIDTNSIRNYSWKQTTDMYVNTNDIVKDNSILSFTAPYVKSSDVNATLSFELTITGNDGKTRNPPYNADVIVKRVQRAMIFQGGVALGAYEAGVYQAIIEKLIKKDEDKKRKGLDNVKRPLFDIVAGASIGAMNGAIVVSSVTKSDKSLEDPKNWEDSAENVMEFWRVQEQLPTIADFLDNMSPFYHYWWDIIHNTSKVFKHSANELTELYSNMNPTLKTYSDILASWFLVEPSIWKDLIIDGWYIPATAEAARRYYSAQQFLHTVGSFNVATGIPLWSAFGKFFDYPWQLSNWVPRPDNKHFVLFSLKGTLEQFAHFPIKTSVEEKQPRLLLVTVDVKTGDAVTFDSYSKEAKYHDDRNTVSNQDGIEIEHALASGTFPDFFDYPKFNVENHEMSIKNEEHIFWDGGFRSNTPLREVIQAHRDYWLSRARKEHKGQEDYEFENDVPDLEIYIADLWPSELKEDPISFDRDFVENKKWNLILGDKTDYDEQVANVVTDYVDLARGLKNLAEQKGASKNDINYILNRYATSINTKGKTRRYRELLEGRFRLTKVVRIDHKDDGNEVNDKVFDYSYKTIEELLKVGYRDALVQMDMQRIKDGVIELAKRNDSSGYIKKEWDNSQIQELEESLYQIQERMKIEDGGYDNDTIIKRQVKNFMEKVESMGEVLLREEKASLIAAVKQLQDTITRVHQKR